MTSTLYYIFLTKRFCQRLQKMLAAEGIVSAYKVHKNVYGTPCGQDIGVNVSCPADLKKFNAVCRAYKAKYSLKNESDINLQALDQGIALTWNSAFKYDKNYWTAHTDSITADGELRQTYKVATKH